MTNSPSNDHSHDKIKINGTHLFCPLCGGQLKNVATVRAIISLMRAVIIALGMILAATVATYNLGRQRTIPIRDDTLPLHRPVK